ncbi:FtsQ-type POTRA domain-containing protein [Olsenella sp. kh2p3]|uniref:cell division protein FtsQ/DivIB n=1 Tax=Olsenella sp. kh2p3 TaxID=1797112 RepID=UPI00091EA2F8|nr:FtsQ-type POTRA domain-containing protein [Olsenella sp. kh2p3]SFX44706.1 cell division protein FtsQ [Olsenella sp. kh2p3]
MASDDRRRPTARKATQRSTQGRSTRSSRPSSTPRTRSSRPVRQPAAKRTPRMPKATPKPASAPKVPQVKRSAPRPQRGTRPQSGREAREARARQVRTADAMGIALRVVVVAAIVAAVLGVAFLVLSNTSTFKIDSIDAVATDHVSADDIQKLASVEEGTTLLNVDTGAITQRLMKNPWIASVSIDREFPDKLKISVTERKVEAVVVMSSRSVAWYLGEGEVWLEPVNLDVSEGQSADDVALEKATSVGAILITGVPATVDPAAGSKATDDVISAVRSYLDGFSSEFASQIVSFSAPSEASLSCVLSSGVEISLGSPSSISSKEDVIKSLLSEYPDELTYINVRVPSSPSYRKIDSSNVTEGSGATGGSASTTGEESSSKDSSTGTN